MEDRWLRHGRALHPISDTVPTWLADMSRAATQMSAQSLSADHVTPLAQLPDLWLSVSDFGVSPVLAWWHTMVDLHPVDRREVATVSAVPITALIDPDNRYQVVHPSGYTGPAFTVSDMLVWGFTAGLLDLLLAAAGLAKPWDRSRRIELPSRG